MDKAALLERQIQLLNDLIGSIEKQLLVKQNQLSVANQHIKGLKEENQILANFIELMKEKLESNQCKESIIIEPFQMSYDYTDKLSLDCDINDLRALAEQMSNELDKKSDEISVMKSQNAILGEKIQRQQIEMTNIVRKYRESQEKGIELMKKMKKLEEESEQRNKQNKQNRQKVSFSRLETKKGPSFKQLQTLRLIKQNNELIQKVRMLQKQKNQKFQNSRSKSPLRRAFLSPQSNIKRMSQVRFQNQQLLIENQHLKSNLRLF